MLLEGSMDRVNPFFCEGTNLEKEDLPLKVLAKNQVDPFLCEGTSRSINGRRLSPPFFSEGGCSQLPANCGQVAAARADEQGA